MSWAAERETTRVEDIAYCLVGIFSVNMPLLYGEGKRAFLRLQEKLVRVSTDQSLFAWRGSEMFMSGPFAVSPASFAESRDIMPLTQGESMEPYATSHRGLRIRLPVIERPYGIMALLNCNRKGQTIGVIGIHLWPTSTGGEDYSRNSRLLSSIPLYDLAAAEECTIHIQDKSPCFSMLQISKSRLLFSLIVPPLVKADSLVYTLCEVYPPQIRDQTRNALYPGSRLCGLLYKEDQEVGFTIVLNRSPDGHGGLVARCIGITPHSGSSLMEFVSRFSKEPHKQKQVERAKEIYPGVKVEVQLRTSRLMGVQMFPLRIKARHSPR
jgi:hypothetical protein